MVLQGQQKIVKVVVSSVILDVFSTIRVEYAGAYRSLIQKYFQNTVVFLCCVPPIISAKHI